METIIEEFFFNKYGCQPLIVRSPGRINIIGEHTDYNEGFVLPAAIDRFAYVGVSKRTDNKILLHARNFNEDYESNLMALAPTSVKWANYLLGVVHQLLQNGFTLSGFNLVFDGTIPVGAGLSSSAAIECATIFALNELFSLQLPRQRLIKMAQMAEHEFVGVKCGIMDQFASMFGKTDHVMKLDCRSLSFEYVPFVLRGYRILLLNTNVKHELVSSGYNARRMQCEQAVDMVKKYITNVNSLRDVTIEMLDNYVSAQDPIIYKRSRYVVEENKRLLQACEDLKAGDLTGLGQKMFATHKGLSEDFEVSCEELDFLVDSVKDNPDVLGARMLGGGFGGCTINIVKQEAIFELIGKVSKRYSEELNLELTAYIANIGQGTELIDQENYATV